MKNEKLEFELICEIIFTFPNTTIRWIYKNTQQRKKIKPNLDNQNIKDKKLTNKHTFSPKQRT